MLFRKRFLCLLLGLACLLSLSAGALAAQVDCDAVYCFTTQDFSEADEALTGICITHLPDAGTGTVLLGSRVLQPGDILVRFAGHRIGDTDTLEEYLHQHKPGQSVTVTIYRDGHQYELAITLTEEK